MAVDLPLVVICSCCCYWWLVYSSFELYFGGWRKLLVLAAVATVVVGSWLVATATSCEFVYWLGDELVYYLMCCI